MDESNFVGQDQSKSRIPYTRSKFHTEVYTPVYANTYRLTDLESSQTVVTVSKFSSAKSIGTSADIVLGLLEGNCPEGKETSYSQSELLILSCQTYCGPLLNPYLTIRGTSTVSGASESTRSLIAEDQQLHYFGVIVRLEQLTSMSVVSRQLRSSLGDFLCLNYFLLIYILR
jgi:hypothetical protein